MTKYSEITDIQKLEVLREVEEQTQSCWMKTHGFHPAKSATYNLSLIKRNVAYLRLYELTGHKPERIIEILETGLVKFEGRDLDVLDIEERFATWLDGDLALDETGEIGLMLSKLYIMKNRWIGVSQLDEIIHSVDTTPWKTIPRNSS